MLIFFTLRMDIFYGQWQLYLDIWEDSRLDIEALGTQFFPSRLESSPAFSTRFYVLQDLLKLLCINLLITQNIHVTTTSEM